MTRLLSHQSVSPRYPIYVPSRGRWENPLTARALAADGVDFYVVVEPQEAGAYVQAVGAERVLVLPFQDRGSSTPARNWIRDHAIRSGAERHWQLDDNISGFYRLWDGRRVPVHAGVSLRVCEDFTDRFENVGVSGLNYDMFVPADTPTPYRKNVHVYSISLVNHQMPYSWRLLRNEDTDLCLQALVGGWATIALNAFTAKKVTTMTMGGGNTDALYREDGEPESGSDTVGRMEMARALERAWPGIVKMGRRFGRYQHSVDWKRFESVPLRLRPDVDLSSLPAVDEYGMDLVERHEVRSARIRALLLDYQVTRFGVSAADDPLWRGLPAFRPRSAPPKLTLDFQAEEDRDALVNRLGVTVDKKFENKAWSAWWPPRGRDDPASLRFEPVTVPALGGERS